MTPNSMPIDTLDAEVELATLEIGAAFDRAQLAVYSWDLMVCPPPPWNRGAVKK